MMTITTTSVDNSQLAQLESWLKLLIQTYADHPSDGLAKVISYYIDRLLSREEITDNGQLYCQYISMKKFWLWQCQKR